MERNRECEKQESEKPESLKTGIRKAGALKQLMRSMSSLWTLLERAKRDGELSKDAAFIGECAIHPDFFVVIANDRQLKELFNTVHIQPNSLIATLASQ
jgi:hypothetical protein